MTPRTFANGFLPETDPLTRLPNEHDCPLNLKLNLMLEQLPKLLEAKTLRSALDVLNKEHRKTPLIEIDHNNEAEVNLAYMMLTMLIQAYLWQNPLQPVTVMPRIIGENIANLQRHHPRIPVLTYADYVIYNWCRIKSDEGITLDNVKPIFTFTGDSSEAWFIKTHVAIEATFSEAIVAAERVCELIEMNPANEDRATCKGLYLNMARSTAQTITMLKRMDEHCHPHSFFHRFRPYLEGAEKAQGIRFDLPGQEHEIHLYRGSSGAQSSVLPALDAILNVEHEENAMTQSLRGFLDYMPAKHKDLILRLHQAGAKATSQNPRKDRPEKQQAILELFNFRQIHKGMPAEYITKQASNSGLPLEKFTGTGSTSYGLFLNKRAKETLEAAKREGWRQAKI